MISFVVRGAPATQGSKTPVAVRRKGPGGERIPTGQINMLEGKTKASRVHFESWRETVKSAAIRAMADSDVYPLDGPLMASMIFTLRRPKGHFRSGKSTSHLLREGAPPYPECMPDVIKMARAVEDAMRDAGVYLDDAQIVSYKVLMKVYPDHPSGSPFPGVWVKIRRMPLPIEEIGDHLAAAI